MKAAATLPDIGRHIVGNALVLHSGEKISHEAQSLALAVDRDADNDIVVLDLQDDVPVKIWESVARSIDKSRRGIRLVICGARTNAALFAGQWLAERLKRTVVAPQGHMIRGTAGSLFVHADSGGGWIRHRPGKAPAWEAKRYPRPPWDAAAAEFRPTSALGAVEPLPGGVWIRDSRDAQATRGHWSWLSSSLPCQPEALTVVVGCPGTPPLALDDIARFWRNLPADDRRRARFVHYGPVRLAPGEVLGQVLADLLQEPVACFVGIPVGRPDRPQMHTAALHGGLGWQVFARELGFLPRPGRGRAAPLPQILSYRAPRTFGEPIEPMVYQYSSDAVVEIVQSGLWVRARVAPPNADRVRARVPDPTAHALIYDDTDPVTAPRMRALGEDLVSRLDPATRTLSAMLPATQLIAAAAPASFGSGDIDFKKTSVFTAADLGLPAELLRAAAPPPRIRDAAGSIEDEAPSVDDEATAVRPLPTVTAPVLPEIPVLRRQAPGRAGGRIEPLEPGRFLSDASGGPARRRTTDPADADPEVSVTDRLSPVPLWQQPVPATEVPVPEAPAPARTPVAAVPATVSPEPAPTEPDLDLPPPQPQPLRRRVPGDTWLTPEGRRLLAGHGSSYESEPEPEPERPAGVDTGPIAVPLPAPPAEFGRHRRSESRRRQPVPDPDARGLPTDAGLSEERAWVRRSFAREFDAAASSIARMLSEHPRLNSGDPADAVTDAVAVRLYLSGEGDGLDKELRSGTLGGHVPFARCVAAGLGRLPSHRGACLLRAAVDPAELDRFTPGEEFTDWSFVNALTGLAPELPGADVMIWAMSARRTRVLEPADGHRVDGRVVFLPGTAFKVLDVEPGRLLLRELSPDENATVHSPFDDLALAALRQCAERWTVGNPFVEVGPAATERFTTLPGTV